MTPPTPSDPPAVTVLIPAYNLAKYLADAVESVLQQTYRGPLRIIVLDDGSTDDTLRVARRLAEREPRIEVHTQPNRGRAETRDRLVALAPTNILAWLDADDLASPTWLEDQVDFLLHHPACVAISGQGYSMTGSGRAIGPMRHPLDGEEIDRLHINGQANAFFQSCVLVRKSAVERADMTVGIPARKITVSGSGSPRSEPWRTSIAFTCTIAFTPRPRIGRSTLTSGGRATRS